MLFDRLLTMQKVCALHANYQQMLVGLGQLDERPRCQEWENLEWLGKCKLKRNSQFISEKFCKVGCVNSHLVGTCCSTRALINNKIGQFIAHLPMYTIRKVLYLLTSRWPNRRKMFASEILLRLYFLFILKFFFETHFRVSKKKLSRAIKCEAWTKCLAHKTSQPLDTGLKAFLFIFWFPSTRFSFDREMISSLFVLIICHAFYL